MRLTNHSTKRLLLTCTTFWAVAATALSLSFLQAKAQEHEEVREAHDEIEKMIREEHKMEGQSEAAHLSVLGIKPDEFVDFFDREERAGKLTEKASVAWMRLIKGSEVAVEPGVKATDYESADITSETLAAYFSLRRSKISDDLRISPEDVSRIQDHWTREERVKYVLVLRRAADIADKGEAATPESSYEQALREYAERAANCR
jgi:hypothetical protein